MPPRARLSSVLRRLIGIVLLPASALAQSPESPLLHEPENPLLRGFRWRSIGPVGQGGRVDDIEVDGRNPSTYYIGYAVGGILKTVNNGTTFTSIFDRYGSASIADLALAPSNPNILYGHRGGQQPETTSYGEGLYKSSDGGETFTNVGFRAAQTLGRVIVHPRDPNTVWVAVGGHLYGPIAERGVFMTTDGGQTWTKTLFVDENTGCSDLAMDPGIPAGSVRGHVAARNPHVGSQASITPS